MKEEDKRLIQQLADEDDTVGVLQELLRMAEAGELTQGALKFKLEDGTEQEFVFGAESEEERELLIATLHSKMQTNH